MSIMQSCVRLHPVVSTVGSGSSSGTHASILPKTLCNVFGRDLNVLIPSRPGRFSKSGQVSTVGVPHNDQIFSSWSKSVLPGRIGFRVNISAKIHLGECSK